MAHQEINLMIMGIFTQHAHTHLVSDIFLTIHATQSCKKYDNTSVKNIHVITIKTIYGTGRLQN